MICTTKVSVVIPIFNEEKNFEKLFEDIKYLELQYFKKNYLCNFLLIDDQSTDSSYSILNEILERENSSNIKLIQNHINLGYAGTIIKGYEYLKDSSDLYMVLPGDAEVNVKTLSPLPNNINFDLFFFERKNLSARPILRILISYLYRILISLLFFKKIEDYNGIFILSNNFLNQIKITSNSFFISAEIIIKANILNKKIYKGSFHLAKKPFYKSTSLNIKQLIQILKDLTKLRKFRNITCG